MVLLKLLMFVISINNIFVGAIQGGEYSSVRSVPYQIQIYFKYPNGMISYCGAAIISDHWVASAAHCIKNEHNIITQVRVGTSSTADKGQLINVTKILVPSDYNERNYDSDICLLKTQDSIQFNEYQQPIPIARSSPKPGDIVTLSGYGDGHYGMMGESLKIAKVPVIDNKLCPAQYEVISEKMFCTSTVKVDLCFGDSGSPVAMNGKLVGIASQGCEYTKPNVIVDVAKFYDWIIKSTGIKYYE